MTKAILTDVEGTTSSIAFVAETLFPYARERLPAFVAANRSRVDPILAQVGGDDPVPTLLRWIEEDRKETPLKTLQGMIWAEGYASGALVGHVYPDAAEALRRWHEAGLKLYVYSSGSVEAQKLLFRHSDQGDLSAVFSGHFDTTIGAKQATASYARIADTIGLEPHHILFLSDHPAEIAAAAEAGMTTRLIARERGDSFANIVP